MEFWRLNRSGVSVESRVLVGGVNQRVSVYPWQTPSTQSQPETPLQSELLPDLTGAVQSPSEEHIVSPPSTVDTAALSEEPLPGEPGWISETRLGLF